jgi:hypothetical protein
MERGVVIRSERTLGVPADYKKHSRQSPKALNSTSLLNHFRLNRAEWSIKRGLLRRKRSLFLVERGVFPCERGR